MAEEHADVAEPDQNPEDWSIGGCLADCYTTDQMRAYADAIVRHALQAARHGSRGSDASGIRLDL